MRVFHMPLQLSKFSAITIRMRAWLRGQRWQTYLRACIQFLGLGFYLLPLLRDLNTLHEVLKVTQGIGAWIVGNYKRTGVNIQLFLLLESLEICPWSLKRLWYGCARNKSRVVMHILHWPVLAKRIVLWAILINWSYVVKVLNLKLLKCMAAQQSL